MIEQVQRPTLIMAHNKTLAAQLYGEFKELFPENAVEYFVSYYDYYQPEAYVPSHRHVHREGLAHQRGDRSHAPRGDALGARRGATSSSSRRCRASTASAIPTTIAASSSISTSGQELRRDALLRRLVDMQYERNDVDFHRGTFRVRGDIVEVFSAYEEETALRIEFFGDEIEASARSIRCAARC